MTRTIRTSPRRVGIHRGHDKHSSAGSRLTGFQRGHDKHNSAGSRLTGFQRGTRAAFVLVLAGLAACTGMTSIPASPQATTVPPTPLPTATLTPVPSLVLMAEGDSEMAAPLREWAEARNWQLLLANPQGANTIQSEPGIEPRAVVSLKVALTGDLTAIGGSVVLVEVVGATVQPNVSTVGEPGGRHDQAGFLAGVMVGLASQTEWVGLVSESGSRLEGAHVAGFDQGMRYACPKCRIVRLTASEASVDGFRGKGVDVVFPVPGPETVRIASEVGAAGIWIVWIGEVPSEVPAASVAGRVAFELESLILAALDDLVAGRPGAAWPFAIENGGLYLADLNDEAISPGRQRLVQEAYDSVASGELDIGIDIIEGQ